MVLFSKDFYQTLCLVSHLNTQTWVLVLLIPKVINNRQLRCLDHMLLDLVSPKITWSHKLIRDSLIKNYRKICQLIPQASSVQVWKDQLTPRITKKQEFNQLCLVIISSDQFKRSLWNPPSLEQFPVFLGLEYSKTSTLMAVFLLMVDHQSILWVAVSNKVDWSLLLPQECLIQEGNQI